MNKGKIRVSQQMAHTIRKQFGGHFWRCLGAVVTASVLLTACSGSSKSSDMSDATMSKESSMEYASTDQIYKTDSGSGAATAVNEERESENTAVESSVTEAVGQSGRKLIKNVDMDVETEEYDKLLSNVKTKIEALNGYVENLSTGEDASYKREEGRNRYASITARIPAEKVDQFVTNISEISNVIRKNESVNDVTLQYVDLESHKKALLTEEKRLMELLGNAENVEDIISIETRLSEVRYQIDSMESQLRVFDNQINYSTVYIYITEVNRLTPAEGEGIWGRITTGFMENIYRVGNGFKNFVIGFLVNLPIIAVFAVICVILFLLFRFSLKIRNQYRGKASIKRNVKQNQIKVPYEESVTSEGGGITQSETIESTTKQ